MIDKDGRTEEEIKELKDKDIIVLERPELENYLWDESVVSKNHTLFKKVEKFYSEINIIKDDLKRSKLNQHLQDHHILLAEIISEMRNENKDENNPNIYWQLHDCIFGDSVKDELEKAEFNQERLRSIAKSFGVKPEKQADDDMINPDKKLKP